MRAELAAIHVALNVPKHDPWLGIFTYSKTSLHAIQNELQRPSHTTYHHHKPLIAAVVDSLLHRAKLGLTTIFWSSGKLPFAARKWHNLRVGWGCRALALAAREQQRWGELRGCHDFLLVAKKVRNWGEGRSSRELT